MNYDELCIPSNQTISQLLSLKKDVEETCTLLGEILKDVEETCTSQFARGWLFRCPPYGLSFLHQYFWYRYAGFFFRIPVRIFLCFFDTPDFKIKMTW